MNTEKKTLDVCLTPALIENFNTDNTIIVIIDVVRASSTICTAFYYGANEIIPVADKDKALNYKKEGYLIAGERNGEKLEGFDFGNSPFEFMSTDLEGEKIAITTTNGTRNIETVSKHAGIDSKIVIGAFVNYKVLQNYLRSSSKNILLVCSGWKGNVSIEDTIFAGKLVEDLNRFNQYLPTSDAANHALIIYEQAKSDIFGFIMDQSMRFKDKISLLGNDIRYCLKEDATNAIPVLVNGKFINKQEATGN
ncbi:MAG: 2-phosphosulfolactate phosphatase [Bacteroidales bacterium]|nr:2-phosphosulfolactate phosphatase [Bacteroidales bacterium]